MADTKISALTALAAADVDTAADVLAIVDTGSTATKKITVDNLRTAMGPKLSTEQATTSGTSIDFTDAPAWAKKVTINFVGVSTSGTSNYLIQIGDSGGVETSGYLGAGSILSGSSASTTSYTAGFGMPLAAATNAVHGSVVLSLEDSSDFTWTASGVVAAAAGSVVVVAGSKSLSAALDRVRITTANGSDTFDAGAVNIIYE